MARIGQIDLFTKRIKKLPKVKELALHTMVADDLKRWCRPEWRYTHVPSGELRTKATAGKLKRMGVMPGWPDFILIGPPGVHNLELKREGELLNDAQREFRDFCHSNGTPYEVAWTYREAVHILSRWGVLIVELTV
jgi:hypothetical protein